MQEITRRRAIAIGLRARLPLAVRALALAVLVAGLVFIGISYYRLRNNKPFRLFGKTPELSKTVVSVIEGYERVEMDGDRVRLLVRAARDITYSDGHHELENVHLEFHPKENEKFDQIDAQRSIYDAEQQAISFSGDVRIETRDALKVKTEAVVYNHKNETGETQSPITFERENVSGRSTGAFFDAKHKRLDLRSAVEIIVAPEIKQGQSKADPRAQPVTIRSANAVFDQASMSLTFAGGATAEQGRDIFSGDTLSARLNEQKRLQKVEARGNSYLRSMTEGRAAEIHAAEMDFFLDASQQLEHAIARLDVTARSLDADSDMQLTGAQALDVHFQAQGDHSLLREMKTAGRSVVTLSAPKSRANDPKAANKRLTADELKLFWRTAGRDLERAEAIGNAELFVDPVQRDASADRKTLQAPRFDCEFYETGNLARNFTATGGARVVIEPLQPSEQRSTRTMTAQKMAAVFVRETQDVERVDAQGDSKFNEQDRNGTADNASYTASDETIRLRGGEPTVWDSRARTKAAEMDSDTRKDISYGRGKTTTTYYSQEQTGGATPFGKVKSPVYIVADRAEFRHATGVGIYTGNARAWQDDNFVRADKLTLYRENKRMEGDGQVQSALYNARTKNASGSKEVVPVFATAERMWYADTDRLLHYEGSVDIKQGTDRIRSGVADVYLQKEGGEVERTIAERNVIVTQPGRQGTGNWAQYTAADETVILKGSPARVEDAEQGTSESGRLTVYLRENRVVSDSDKGQQSTGRVRSVHRVKKP
ncbi:MAG TPA: LPS export ABC transporter periplasmic protein LptC [Pyrinomonadaceae bacterium]|jgi:LPS export ABC transporter protein LptC